MNNNNLNPTITLTNRHGAYTVEVDILNLAILKTKNRSDALIRRQAAGACGFDEADWDTAFLGDSRLEVLIAWVESGNHTF